MSIGKKAINDKDNWEIIAPNMKLRLDIPNELEMIFNSEEYSNSSEFIDIDKVESVDNFPKLSSDYILNNITHQLKQCYSYLAEHLNKE
ncbi:unnamed protein product [Brachionus calyciflorus]|uniref:Uncharacterized protein n=1 Tax=Brachionus calyciflorus TaxID=104777 RepID=A0A814NM68_9BILA|nr:unnamed protein product [Brachionus calyciflorus]